MKPTTFISVFDKENLIDIITLKKTRRKENWSSKIKSWQS